LTGIHSSKNLYESGDISDRRSAKSYKAGDFSLISVNGDKENITMRNLRQSRNECDRIKIELSTAISEIKHLNKVIIQLQSELEVKTRDSEELKKAWSTSALGYKMFNELEGKVNELKVTIATKDEAIKELERKHKSLVEENDSLKRKLKLESLRLKDVELELRQAKIDLENCKEDYESSKLALSKSEYELREEKKKLNDNYKELLFQKDSLQNWIEAADSNDVLVNALQEKIKQIAKEKHDYELLLTKYISY